MFGIKFQNGNTMVAITIIAAAIAPYAKSFSFIHLIELLRYLGLLRHMLYLTSGKCLYDLLDVEILEIFLRKSILLHFMFVVTAEIQIKKGSEDEFKNWIKESNAELSKFDGFVRRRLL